MIRDDLSEKLIHLTRDFDGYTGKDRFYQILNTKKLTGTNTNIRSKQNCVCFSEAPISSIGRIIASNRDEIRYAPYGFMFSKEYLFKLGARPVIYQTEEEYGLLPMELQYKHVAFNIISEKVIDWTWEREWRLQNDYIILDPKKVTLIIPKRIDLDNIIVLDQSRKRAISTRTFGPFPQTDWHFIVLEDLGFSIDTADA